MPNKNKNISLPSEFELIQKIEDLLSDSDPDVILGVGDDAAVVKPRLGLQTVLTTDTFVEGVDFNVNFSSWWQIGWKCMAANFSDIAAMGGSPRHTLVTLCLPVQRIYKEIEDLYQGFHDLANRLGLSLSLVGGDLSSIDGPSVISIALIGEIDGENIIKRSGAKIGDFLCVTGHVGGSQAGLHLIKKAQDQPSLERILDKFEETLTRHRTPLPRIREGLLMSRTGWVHAMIDVSDGISSDALHICRNSKVGLHLDVTALPIADETKLALEQLRLDPIETALESGEEFELLCTVDPENLASLVDLVGTETGTLLTPIGEITPQDQGYKITDQTGTYSLLPKGYEHFRS